jgi:hypothetical protein
MFVVRRYENKRNLKKNISSVWRQIYEPVEGLLMGV